MTPTHVGFVGLGRMGWPMARLLAQAEFPLTVFDVDDERRTSFAAEHSCAAATGPDDFAAVAVVVTMLPDDRDVASALDADSGIAGTLARGSVVVDMSSSNPEGTKLLGAALAPLGIALVDAPVSGGVQRAVDGTLTLMIGGDDQEAITRVLPVLEVLGERLFRTGHSARATR